MKALFCETSEMPSPTDKAEKTKRSRRSAKLAVNPIAFSHRRRLFCYAESKEKAPRKARQEMLFICTYLKQLCTRSF